MSTEIWQVPSAATKKQLTTLLEELGFEARKNVFWPGPKGTASLFWSEPQDFKSTSGVDASVFPLNDEGKEALKTTNDWALRTRTSIWASSFDKEYQNRTVRLVRKVFGGSFYNDHYGHNRYNLIEKKKSTPASRGIYSVLTRINGELEALEAALPDAMANEVMTPGGKITEKSDKTGILQVAQRLDPSRVVYNALVPFLVAAIEHFFRDSFEIMLKYDDSAQSALESGNKRVSYAEASALVHGDLAIERIASGWYSFQNVDSIQKAYKEVFGIDVWKVLRRRKKVRDKLPLLMNELKSLIGARHGVVHHFYLDRALDRESFLDLLHLIHAILDHMAIEIERKLGVPLGPG
jgi:hypothetical protein